MSKKKGLFGDIAKAFGIDIPDKEIADVMEDLLKNPSSMEQMKQMRQIFKSGHPSSFGRAAAPNGSHARRRLVWTPKQLDKLNKVQEILKELDAYKPLTLRQIYYQLVGKGYIDNNKSQYTMLSGLLKWARMEGHISWDAVEDRTRAFHDLRGWSSKDNFIKRSYEDFLTGYQRDLMQTQDKYVEMWIEKDALSSIFTKVARPYTIPVVVCKGFSSVSFLHDFAIRMGNRHTLMLYFGDFDPSGMEMLESMKQTLEYEMHKSNVDFKRVALLKEDVARYKLPHNPDALKRTDTRAIKHLEQYGEVAVELDALRPDVLEKKIKDAIEGAIDIDAFNEEVERHNEESEQLDKLRTGVLNFIAKRKGK